MDEPEIGPESEKKKSFFKSFTSKKLEKDEMDSSQNSKKQSSTEAISIEKVQKKKVISESPNSSLNGNVTRADKANSSASDSTPISDVAVGSKPEETGRKKKTNVRFNSIEGFGLDEKTKREIILDEQEDLTAMTNKTNVDRIEGGIVVPSDVNVTWSAENLQIAAEDEHTGFSRETIAGGGFLAVSVMRGEMVRVINLVAFTISYQFTFLNCN